MEDGHLGNPGLTALRHAGGKVKHLELSTEIGHVTTQSLSSRELIVVETIALKGIVLTRRVPVSVALGQF